MLITSGYEIGGQCSSRLADDRHDEHAIGTMHRDGRELSTRYVDLVVQLQLARAHDRQGNLPLRNRLQPGGDIGIGGIGQNDPVPTSFENQSVPAETE